jgi:hypothetical protein
MVFAHELGNFRDRSIFAGNDDVAIADFSDKHGMGSSQVGLVTEMGCVDFYAIP